MLRGAALGAAVLGAAVLLGFVLPLYPGNLRLSGIGYGSIALPGLLMVGWTVFFAILCVLLLTVPLLRRGRPNTPVRWALIGGSGLAMALALRTLRTAQRMNA